ncbi:MAG TPA: DUF2520 domain-containing protein [Acidimicrobiales bacterium]|nr:DUF2520 domain-containing protein [Acidimicrobiales bacterium]
MLTFRVVGPGRAGQSLQLALEHAGWRGLAPLGRGDDLIDAAAGADVVLIATPDGAIADAAAAIRPVPGVAVVHLAGSLGLDVLAPHDRRASVHPIVALPDADTGAARLRGAWFAVAGDAVAREIVAALDGRSIEVPDDKRALHHAAAVIASNHVVALLGQVERVAAEAGVPLAAYLDLVRATLDNVAELGPRNALTGPVARGDWATIARHLDALPADERAGYEAMVELAKALAGERVPWS